MKLTRHVRLLNSLSGKNGLLKFSRFFPSYFVLSKGREEKRTVRGCQHKMLSERRVLNFVSTRHVMAIAHTLKMPTRL